MKTPSDPPVVKKGSKLPNFEADPPVAKKGSKLPNFEADPPVAKKGSKLPNFEADPPVAKKGSKLPNFGATLTGRAELGDGATVGVRCPGRGGNREPEAR